MNLVLIGYRGTGKSAIARKLGSLLAMQVTSLDQEIVQVASMPIPDIVAAHGWNRFRDLEEAVCLEFGAKDGIILDCGGGVVEREANFASLRAGGKVFWLRATPTTIVGRIGGDSARPSLTGTKSFTEEVEEVLGRRTPLYERLAHAAIDTDGRSLDDLALTIARRFQVASAQSP
ncbi:MAG TPA: shikimate kinase [Polyangia bacterium]